VNLLMVPTCALFGILGGWWLAAFASLVLGLAAYEFITLYRAGGNSPLVWVTVPTVMALPLLRQAFGFQHSDLVLAAAVVISMVACSVLQERRGNFFALSWAATLAGILYLGWLGAYVVSLRNLPNGMWWTLIVFPAVSLTDAGGYLFGRWLGRHKMSLRVSPNKTWEGYAGGVFFAIAGGLLLSWLWGIVSPEITLFKGTLLSAVIGITVQFGDIGESMLKRSFGMKDSSNLLPGHGGMMDRIDSSLFAAVIGFYVVSLL